MDFGQMRELGLPDRPVVICRQRHHQAEAGCRKGRLRPQVPALWNYRRSRTTPSTAFTIGPGGLRSGGRCAQGNLEATPLVDNGMMYVPDGWGSVYAIENDRASRCGFKPGRPE